MSECPNLLPIVEQELLTRPNHLSSSPVFRGVLVVKSLVFLGVFDIYCLSFCLFSFILSVLLLLSHFYHFLNLANNLILWMYHYFCSNNQWSFCGICITFVVCYFCCCYNMYINHSLNIVVWSWYYCKLTNKGSLYGWCRLDFHLVALSYANLALTA